MGTNLVSIRSCVLEICSIELIEGDITACRAISRHYGLFESLNWALPGIIRSLGVFSKTCLAPKRVGEAFRLSIPFAPLRSSRQDQLPWYHRCGALCWHDCVGARMFDRFGEPSDFGGARMPLTIDRLRRIWPG